MICNRHLDFVPFGIPETLTKRYRLEYLDGNGQWLSLVDEEKNYQRVNLIRRPVKTKAVRFTPLETYGEEKAHVFAFDVR